MTLALTLRQRWPNNNDSWRVFAPPRLVQQGTWHDVIPFENLRTTFAEHYCQEDGHVFIGACGIAVRTVAPLLKHKSMDPAVVVLDTAGRFAISLVSGHMGGGNELAHKIALLLNATPVVTTASDTAQIPSLDMIVQELGLNIVDWGTLPRVQAAFLECSPLHIWDPCRALWPYLPSLLRQHCTLLPDDPPPPAPSHVPQLAVHWHNLAEAPLRMRIAIPCLVVGMGCRKDIAFDTVVQALADVCERNNFPREAIAALATVTEKGQESALQQLAHELLVPLLTYDACTAAAITTPNPSQAAGKRFGTRAFSVCEATALLGAGMHTSALVVPKVIVGNACTVAVAKTSQTSAI